MDKHSQTLYLNPPIAMSSRYGPVDHTGRGIEVFKNASTCPSFSVASKFIVFPMILVIIGLSVLVGLKFGGVLDDDKIEKGYAYFRITATEASSANPNITVLTSRLMAVYITEDATADLDKGHRELLWIHPTCINKTFGTCNATALAAINLLDSASGLKTALASLGQNRTIKANVAYHYMRFYTCDLADTADAATTTFSYKSGNMNVTKSFRDTRCNFTSTAINPPINVQTEQGVIVTASFNASAVAVESVSEPVATAFANLTKSGPHATKYYTMNYPVWTGSFYQCNTTTTPAFALACAP